MSPRIVVLAAVFRLAAQLGVLRIQRHEERHVEYAGAERPGQHQHRLVPAPAVEPEPREQRAPR